MQSRNPNHRAGFTLVEIVVVIAIVALLITLLLPAIKRGRDVTLTVICQSNKRSLGHALLAYAAENKDQPPIIPVAVGSSITYPWGTVTNNASLYGHNYTPWPWFLNTYIDAPFPTVPINGKRNTVYSCPGSEASWGSGIATYPMNTSKFVWGGGGGSNGSGNYIYNSNLSYSQGANTVDELNYGQRQIKNVYDDVKKQSRFMVFVEPNGGPTGLFYSLYTTDYSFQFFPHSLGLTVHFLDGHGEVVPNYTTYVGRVTISTDPNAILLKVYQ